MIIRCLKISRSYWIFYCATRVSSNRLESPNTLEFKCKSSKRIHKNTYSIETLLKENVFLAWLASWNRPISRFLKNIFNFHDATIPLRIRYYVLRIQYTIEIFLVHCRQQSISFHVNAFNDYAIFVI